MNHVISVAYGGGKRNSLCPLTGYIHPAGLKKTRTGSSGQHVTKYVTKLFFLMGRDSNYRAQRKAHHLFGNRAQQQVTPPGEAVGSHDYCTYI